MSKIIKIQSNSSLDEVLENCEAGVAIGDTYTIATGDTVTILDQTTNTYAIAKTLQTNGLLEALINKVKGGYLSVLVNDVEIDVDTLRALCDAWDSKLEDQSLSYYSKASGFYYNMDGDTLNVYNPFTELWAVFCPTEFKTSEELGITTS